VKVLISGGRIIDPSQQIDQVSDLLIENGCVKSIGAWSSTASRNHASLLARTLR